MSIPINDIVPRIQAILGAGQTVVNYPFPIFAATDLKAYQTATGVVANDANDILTLNVDYTVTGVGAAAGGTIVLTVGATNLDIVTIIRDMPEDRMNLYQNGGLFTAAAVNDDFSREVMMNQQNEMHSSDLIPHYNNSAVTTQADLLLPLLPAGTSWRKNAAGTAIEAFTNAGGGVVLPSTLNHVVRFADAVGGIKDSDLVLDNNALLSQTIAPFAVLNYGHRLPVTQAAHGFVAPPIVVRSNGAGGFSAAQADSAANAEVIGIITSVQGVNNFSIQIDGYNDTNYAGLTPGSVYYLSPINAGNITATKPSTPGQVIKPILIAFTATTVFLINQLGVVI